jgi:hypothetical protein
MVAQMDFMSVLRLAYEALQEQPGLQEHVVAEGHYRYPRWTQQQAQKRVEAKRALRRVLGEAHGSSVVPEGPGKERVE